MAARAFYHAGGDRPAGGERLVVAQVFLIVLQVAHARLHADPLAFGQPVPGGLGGEGGGDLLGAAGQYRHRVDGYPVFGGTAQDTPVDVATCNRTNAQLWWPANFTVSAQSAVHGTNCLNDYNDAIGPVVILPCSLSDSQTWLFGSSKDIANVNGAWLEADPPNSASLGSVTMIGSFDRYWPGSYWSMQYGPSGTGGVKFANGFSGPYGPECLDVAGGSSMPYTPVDIWQCSGAANQTWYLRLIDQ